MTLLEQEGETCWGRAYRVCPSACAEVLATLDHREKGGYSRIETTLHFDEQNTTEALVYIATADNPNFMGESSVEEIAAVVRTSHGPSGSNREYILKLHQALLEIGASDPHASSLASMVSDLTVSD